MSLTNPEAHMNPKQLKKLKEDEAKQLEVKRLKELQAKERKAEREKFRNCDHIYVDVTEERRSIISKHKLPGWVKRLIEAKDYRWSKRSEAWKISIYEKCTECGLLKISREEKNG